MSPDIDTSLGEGHERDLAGDAAGVHEEMLLERTKEHPFTPTPSGLLAHVALCLVDWAEAPSMEALEGLFGHAFESSYARKGAELWFGCDLEWSHHDRGLGRVSPGREVVQMVGKPHDGPAPSAEHWQRELERGWALVVRSIDGGRPVLGWSLMSSEQAHNGLGAFCWGVVYGYDPSTRDYLVRHRDAGLHRVRFDALGRVDSVNWFCLTRLTEPAAGVDWGEATKSALRDGVRFLRGEMTSATMPAPPRTIVHGVEALTTLADELERGECAAQTAMHQAKMWARARQSAEAFCQWGAPKLPASSHALERAAEIFSREASALERAASGEDAPTCLKRAAQLQRDAIDAIKLL